MLLLGITSMVLGIAFLLIFIGTYGLVIFVAPYSKWVRHLVELIMGTNLAALNRPLNTTPWWKLLRSSVLVVIRVGLIVTGVLVLLRVGFLGQNLIWLLLHR